MQERQRLQKSKKRLKLFNAAFTPEKKRHVTKNRNLYGKRNYTGNFEFIRMQCESV